MTDREILLELRASDVKLEKDLNNIKKTLDNKVKRMQPKKGMFNGFNAEVGMMAAKVTAAFAAISGAMDFAIVTKNAARDAEEIRSKFDQVFSSMTAGANKVADTFADDFDVAGSTARELLGSTGDLLVGFGFTESAALDLADNIARLGSDLASFQNYAGGAAGATKALTSALTGETEGLKSLGIVVRQDSNEFKDLIKKKMKDMHITETQAKALVIYETALKQSGKAVGDYGRTFDSLSNQERRATESIKTFNEEVGKTSADVYSTILGVIMNIGTEAGNTSTAIEAISGAMKIVGIAVVAVIGVVSMLIDGVKALVTNLQNLAYIFESGFSEKAFNKFWEEFKDGYSKVFKDFTDSSQAIDDILYGGKKTSTGSNNSFSNRQSEIDAISSKGLAEARFKEGEELVKIQEKLRSDIAKVNKKWDDIELAKKNGGKSNLTKEEIEAAKKATEKKKEIIEDYYKSVTFADDKYIAWKKSEIDKEAAEMKKKAGNEVNVEIWKNDQLKQLKDDRTKYYGFDVTKGITSDKQEKKEKLMPSSLLLDPLKTEDLEKRQEIMDLAYEQEELFLEAVIALKEESRIREQEIMYAGYDSMVSGMSSTFSEITKITTRSNGLLTNMFVNMANSFIQEIGRMAAEWLAFQAIMGIVNLVLPGSGNTVSAVAGAAKFSGGGDFIVPPGFANDTYPMLVESGERVQVTPANRAGSNEKLLGDLISSVRTMNLNLIESSTNNRVSPIPIVGKIEGNDINIINKRINKIINRLG